MYRLVPFAIAAVLALASATIVACGNDDDATPPGELAISVAAEILEDDAPASVDATTVRPSDDGHFEHTVRVLWEDDEPGSIGDARFAHHVEEDGRSFITAGRGCGAQWLELADGFEGVALPCTDDLQVIWLQTGETHEYPITIYPELERPADDPIRLEPGTYVIDEVVHWVLTDDSTQVPQDDAHFTVRLTYTVQ